MDTTTEDRAVNKKQCHTQAAHIPTETITDVTQGHECHTCGPPACIVTENVHRDRLPPKQIPKSWSHIIPPHHVQPRNMAPNIKTDNSSIRNLFCLPSLSTTPKRWRPRLRCKQCFMGMGWVPGLQVINNKYLQCQGQVGSWAKWPWSQALGTLRVWSGAQGGQGLAKTEEAAAGMDPPFPRGSVLPLSQAPPGQGRGTGGGAASLGPGQVRGLASQGSGSGP